MRLALFGHLCRFIGCGAGEGVLGQSRHGPSIGGSCLTVLIVLAARSIVEVVLKNLWEQRLRALRWRVERRALSCGFSRPERVSFVGTGRAVPIRMSETALRQPARVEERSDYV